MSVADRLQQARRAAGLSMRDLAAKADISAQAISKYERNLDMPSSGVLIRLAKALGKKVEYFFRPNQVDIKVAAYRRKASFAKKQEDQVIGQIQDWLERYLEIEKIMEDESENQFVIPSSVNRKIESVEDAERLAEELRGAWNLGLDPIANFTELLEDRGVKVGFIEGDEGFDGCTFEIEGGIPIIVIKRDAPGDRQRFNLAHELGHIVMQVPEHVDEEKAAHRFAGAFLVPAVMAVKELGHHRTSIKPYELHLMKHKYGLSMQGCLYRAKDVGILGKSKVAQYFRLFNENGWRTREPGDPLPPEVPSRMERLIIRAYEEEIISGVKATELLGKPLSEFWREVAEKHNGFPSL